MLGWSRYAIIFVVVGFISGITSNIFSVLFTAPCRAILVLCSLVCLLLRPLVFRTRLLN